jgi:hypothetical protein
MRKIITLLGVVVALAIPTAALAATLDTGKFGDLIGYGEDCGEEGAYYHFVNNQLGNPGVANGTIWGTIGGVDFGPTGPSMNNGPTQHFYVFGTGELTYAETSLGGKLVLSGVECKK